MRDLESVDSISNISELHDTFFLHPNINTDGDIYLATVYGKQTLIKIKERRMDNSDGSEWRFPGQTKRSVYYLEANEDNDTFDWYFLENLKDY